MPAMQRGYPGHSGCAAAVLRRAAAGLCLAAAIGLAAAGQAQEQPRQRIADDKALDDLLRGQTLRGIYSDGTEWIEYHATDGRSAYWDGCTRSGLWWIADGMVCYRYPNDPAPLDYCWFAYRDGERIEFVFSADGVDGPVGGYTVEILPGNPNHLPLGKTECLSASAAGVIPSAYP